LKGQKELKIRAEILDLDRRDPVWYEWKGKSQGGWQVVPGPYNWGK
jgi:ABC-type transporter MlaC component